MQPKQMIMIALAVVLIGGGGWWWSKTQETESKFNDYVHAGMGALDRVVRHPDHGTSGHLMGGETISYGTVTPTSGRHYPRWVTPGFYDSAQKPTMLVHSMEHGLVIIYYDQLSEDARATLNQWGSLFSGPWSGIVITPQPGFGDKLVLTSWHRSMTLDSFDPAAAAVFIDAYRGRGPENPIR